MKKLIYLMVAIAATVGFYSCSEDFEVAAPYKNITLVYGLLNAEDTAHYIKIQKAFLDEKRNALQMAKVPDSSYYSNLDVVIKELNNNVVVKTILLQRVDVNLEGHVKDTGIFFTSPNYAYKFKETLNPNSKYRLVITNNDDGGSVDSSEIQVLDASKVRVSTFVNGTPLNIAKTVPPGSRLIVPLELPSSARYVEAKIKFRWVEKNFSTGKDSDHEADFTFATQDVASTTINLINDHIAFYSFLKSNMGLPDPNVQRYMDSCQLFIAAGAEEIYDYIIVTNIQSSGLTADQLKPLYTNLLGKDVYGIFSSRAYKIYENVPLSDATIDSFKIHPTLADLNIRGRSDH